MRTTLHGVVFDVFDLGQKIDPGHLNADVAAKTVLGNGFIALSGRDHGMRVVIRHDMWCGRWESNPHDVAIEGF
jgi:hypothetical protein